MIKYLMEKRKITIILFTIIVVLGISSFIQMPKQEMPDIASYTAVITTVYPGASVERVEHAVTKPIEVRLNEMHGIRTITSESREDVSIITVEAEKRVDINKVWSDLRKKMKEAEKDLPEDAMTPTINDELSKSFIQTFNVTADSYDKLYSMDSTLRSWRDQLRTIKNVSDVQITGLPEKEVQVDLDAAKLQEYGITWQQVSAAIQADEKSPPGELETEKRTYKLELTENSRPEQLNRLLIAVSADGNPVYLQDVGKASLAFKKPDYYVSHNGNPAISFTMTANLGSNIPEIQKEVDQKEASFKNDLPAWAKIENVYTKQAYINELFGGLTREMLIAIAAVLLVCSLGLNYITSLIIALSIPISVAVAMLFANMFDITLNQISIYSVIILIGILVDDSVVVNDNINRRLLVYHEDPHTAALEGAKEVATSILTAVIAALCAFGVLAFIPSELGQMARPLPIIAAFAMTISMLMALTIVPIFREWLEQHREKKYSDDQRTDGFIGKPIYTLTEWYSQKILPIILKRSALIGIVTLSVSLAAYGLIFLTPIQLFPAANRPEMLIDIRGSSGSSLENTQELVSDISKWASNQPGVAMVSSYAGGSAPDMFGDDRPLGTGSELGQIIVRLDTKQTTTSKVIDCWYKELKTKFPQAEITPRELRLGIPVGKAVDIRIYGKDTSDLRRLSAQIKDLLKDVEGVRNIQDSMGSNLCTLRLEVNKSLMDDKMITSSALSSTLRLASDGITVSSFDDGKDLISIVLYADKTKADPLERIENLSIPTKLGQQIPLQQIVQTKTVYHTKAINHRNLSRVIDVTGDLNSRDAFTTMSEIKPLIEKLNLPDGYYWEAGGEVSKETDIVVDMLKLLGIAMVLIIITVFIKFNSLSAAFLILLTFLLAISGSFIGLYITGSSIGFMALMGIISLIGIVSRNGIVLIEFIELERQAGQEIIQAVMNAVSARMKPVLLTSSTAIVGLIPLALSSNVLFRPLAIAIIFGLMFATILTLVVVPTFYTMIEHLKTKRQKQKGFDQSMLNNQ